MNPETINPYETAGRHEAMYRQILVILRDEELQQHFEMYLDEMNARVSHPNPSPGQKDWNELWDTGHWFDSDDTTRVGDVVGVLKHFFDSFLTEHGSREAREALEARVGHWLGSRSSERMARTLAWEQK